MRPATYRVMLLTLLALGLLVRLVAVQQRLSRPLSGDELTYDTIAWNLASGHGYSTGSDGTYHPTALRGPAYVLPVAASYSLFGRTPLPILLAQAFLDVLTAWLVARLARRWFADARVALAAVAIYSLYPPFVLSTASLLTETLTQFLVVAGLASFFAYLATRRLGWLASSGVAIGVCALSKPHLAPLGVVFAAASIGMLGLGGAMRAAAVHVAVIGLVLAPWTVRNAVVLHGFVPGVTLGGVALWLGAGPYGGEPLAGSQDPAIPESVRARFGAMSEIEQNRWATAEGLRLIAADPLQALRLGLVKTVRLWFNVGFPHAPSRASMALALFNLAAFVLAAVGARARPSAPATAVIVGLVLYWTLVHAPFFTVVRYALACYALVFVFSAAGIVRLATGVLGRTARDDRNVLAE